MTKRNLKTALLKATIGGAIIFAAAPAFAGDPAPGVDVLLEQIPGGSTYNATVDDQGRVTFPNVPVGNYKITFTKAAETSQPQAQVRQLKKGELDRLLRRGLEEAIRGELGRTPDRDGGDTPAPQPPADAPPAAPARMSLCNEAKSAGANKTGGPLCTPISGFSFAGDATEIIIDEATLQSGPICGEISVTGAGALTLAAVKAEAPTRGPAAAESWNSTRSNDGGIAAPAADKAEPARD